MSSGGLSDECLPLPELRVSESGGDGGISAGQDTQSSESSTKTRSSTKVGSIK